MKIKMEVRRRYGYKLGYIKWIYSNSYPFIHIIHTSILSRDVHEREKYEDESTHRKLQELRFDSSLCRRYLKQGSGTPRCPSPVDDDNDEDEDDDNDEDEDEDEEKIKTMMTVMILISEICF